MTIYQLQSRKSAPPTKTVRQSDWSASIEALTGRGVAPSDKKSNKKQN